jgi:hypothetical protein
MTKGVFPARTNSDLSLLGPLIQSGFRSCFLASVPAFLVFSSYIIPPLKAYDNKVSRGFSSHRRHRDIGPSVERILLFPEGSDRLVLSPEFDSPAASQDERPLVSAIQRIDP